MLLLFFFPPGDQSSASLNGVRLSLKTGKCRAWLLVYGVYSNQNVLSEDLFYVELETETQLTSADRNMARYFLCALPIYLPYCHMTSTALLWAVGTEAPVCIRAFVLTFPNLQEVQTAYKVRGSASETLAGRICTITEGGLWM